uniref:Eukaryotic translation initiation factor 3 subunit K n=2 Tax=Canis lupus familiaris TaxID=9615 RepID=A0A8I3MNE4_CANLF
MVERINCSHPQAGKWVREVKVTEPECCVRGWSPGTCQFLSSEPHSTGYLVRPRDLKRSGPLALSLVPLLRYQFNPAFFQTTVTAQILLKALTNLPHTDFTLCKCMIDQAHQEERPIRQILYLGDLLETCHFQAFWQALDENMDLLEGITGFEDSVRKFICHVVGITYQHIDRWLLAEMLGDLTDSQLKVWMSKYGWSADESGQIFICSQEESIKPKNIVEKIDFDSVSSIMASSQ